MRSTMDGPDFRFTLELAGNDSAQHWRNVYNLGYYYLQFRSYFIGSPRGTGKTTQIIQTMSDSDFVICGTSPIVDHFRNRCYELKRPISNDNLFSSNFIHLDNGWATHYRPTEGMVFWFDEVNISRFCEIVERVGAIHQHKGFSPSLDPRFIRLGAAYE